jgi:hypothetical protein
VLIEANIVSRFDFYPIEIAVAELKINYPSFMFALFCESSETGKRGIVDIGVGSRAKGYSRHTVVVPVDGIAGADQYYVYFRDMLIKADRLPNLVNMMVSR